MHNTLESISSRILQVAIGALAQANTHAAYYDPGKEYWEYMSVINAALAGELFIKAVIAKEHPLLIFRDLFHLDAPRECEMDLESIIEKGKTYSFEHLPKLLWVVTGERLTDPENFEQVRRVRNSIQHFCAPEKPSLKRLALEFLYKNIDPLIHRHFGICAIEYHEDPSVGYDYVVSSLINHEILFSVPNDFCITEIDFSDELGKCSPGYRNEIIRRLGDKGVRLED